MNEPLPARFWIPSILIFNGSSSESCNEELETELLLFCKMPLWCVLMLKSYTFWLIYSCSAIAPFCSRSSMAFWNLCWIFPFKVTLSLKFEKTRFTASISFYSPWEAFFIISISYWSCSLSELVISDCSWILPWKWFLRSAVVSQCVKLVQMEVRPLMYFSKCISECATTLGKLSQSSSLVSIALNSNTFPITSFRQLAILCFYIFHSASSFFSSPLGETDKLSLTCIYPLGYHTVDYRLSIDYIYEERSDDLFEVIFEGDRNWLLIFLLCVRLKF